MFSPLRWCGAKLSLMVLVLALAIWSLSGPSAFAHGGGGGGGGHGGGGGGGHGGGGFGGGHMGGFGGGCMAAVASAAALVAAASAASAVSAARRLWLPWLLRRLWRVTASATVRLRCWVTAMAWLWRLRWLRVTATAAMVRLWLSATAAMATAAMGYGGYPGLRWLCVPRITAIGYAYPATGFGYSSAYVAPASRSGDRRRPARGVSGHRRRAGGRSRRHEGMKVANVYPERRRKRPASRPAT